MRGRAFTTEITKNTETPYGVVEALFSPEAVCWRRGEERFHRRERCLPWRARPGRTRRRLGGIIAARSLFEVLYWRRGQKSFHHSLPRAQAGETGESLETSSVVCDADPSIPLIASFLLAREPVSAPYPFPLDGPRIKNTSPQDHGPKQWPSPCSPWPSPPGQAVVSVVNDRSPELHQNKRTQDRRPRGWS